MTPPEPPPPARGDREAAPVPPLDLRLALPAASAWAAVLLVTPHGTRVATSVGLVGGALAVASAVVVLLRRRALTWRLLGLVAAGPAVVLLPLAARLAAVEDSSLRGLVGSTATVTLRVAEVHPLGSTGIGAAPRVLVSGEVTAVWRAGRSFDVEGPVVAFAPAEGWAGLGRGVAVRVAAGVGASEDDPWLAAVLSVRGPPEPVSGPPATERLATHVRDGLRQASTSLPSGPRGLLPGLVVGDTSGLDPVAEAHFQAAGLTHLVAVSGTNCAIVVGAGVLVLRRLRAGPRITAGIAGGLLALFVLVAGPSPSVVRAAAMAAIALVALATGRVREVVPALAGAVLVGLVWRPALASDPGFAMSVLATGAIVLLGPPVALSLRRARIPVGLAEAVAVASVAHLVTAPVAAAISGQVSVVAIPANVLAEPAVAVTTVLGFLAAVLAAVHPVLGVAPAWLAGWPCRWLLAVAERFGTAPGATVGWWPGGAGGVLLALALAGFAVAVRWRRTRALAVAAVVVATVVQVPVRAVLDRWPPPGWWFAACDVGQGDGLVLAAAPGQAVVVDTGPDPVAMDTCLRGLGVTRVPLLVLTHLDLDHVGGVAGAVRSRTVGAAVTSPRPEPPARSVAIRRALEPEGVPLTAAPIGSSWRVGAVTLEFLAPRADELASGCDPNDCALVIRATVGERRVLLTGDISTASQDRLLAAHPDLRADVLKIPHHGSRFTDPVFLAAVRARLAVVSVGADNRYGHPAPSLLTAVGRLGVPLARTDLDGAVAVTTTAHGLGVVTTRARPAVPAATGRGTRVPQEPPELSARSVTMAACHPPVANPVPAPAAVAAAGPPPHTNSTRSSPVPSPPSWCCSATKACWSRAPPGPSPRPCAPANRRSRWSSVRAVRSRPPRSRSC